MVGKLLGWRCGPASSAPERSVSGEEAWPAPASAALGWDEAAKSSSYKFVESAEGWG